LQAAALLLPASVAVLPLSVTVDPESVVVELPESVAVDPASEPLAPASDDTGALVVVSSDEQPAYAATKANGMKNKDRVMCAPPT